MPLTLAEKSCTPCRGGIPPLTQEQAASYRNQAPGWDLLDGARRIERTYRFKNFREAFAFVERAAALAEAEGHHPEIRFGWGYAAISRCTPRKLRACTRTTSSWQQSSITSRPNKRWRPYEGIPQPPPHGQTLPAHIGSVKSLLNWREVSAKTRPNRR